MYQDHHFHLYYLIDNEMKLDTVATETIGDIFDQWASSVLERFCRRSLAHLQISTWEQNKTTRKRNFNF